MSTPLKAGSPPPRGWFAGLAAIAAALLAPLTDGVVRAADAEPYLVIAETDDSPALTLPSVTAGFDSFDDVSTFLFLL